MKIRSASSQAQRRRFLMQVASGISAPPSLALAYQGPHENEALRSLSTDNQPSSTQSNPVPLHYVRLLPSIYLDALKANQAYLLRLNADRFLHNYHRFAGLPSKAKPYGGWEADTIAGEGLGHYLSALSLMFAQTGNANLKQRVKYIINELERVQIAHGDGYIGGFMRKRKSGEIVDGKEIFAEIKAGDIQSAGFDLNGCWVPFYNWHKVFAGLLDAHSYCDNQKALMIASGLARYMAHVIEALNDEQLQTVLNCEHGGINESFAELFVRTGERRWLALAERLFHAKTLHPLTQGEDQLANLHANTQIPKVIGLARLAEITDKESYRKASLHFWNSVVEHHSYVIGGHGDREYFDPPDTQHLHISEQTCEACGTYNMLKLTRHLYAWKNEARYFDFFERAHLNHIMAHQDPKTGMFTYMTPLMSGTAREYSTEEDSFWCCVLSGLESHAKHGDSIYWTQGDKLIINLFIPSKLSWKEQKFDLSMTGSYPYHGEVKIRIDRSEGQIPRELALRIPDWATSFTIKLNNKSIPYRSENAYCRLQQIWQKGDVLTLSFPMQLRMVNQAGRPAKANDSLIAVMHGPLVLAADLGPSQKPFQGPSPALVGTDLLSSFTKLADTRLRFKSNGIGKPGDMQFAAFFQMYDRRAAVYFPRFTDSEWRASAEQFELEEQAKRELTERSIDIMYLGEMQAERDHHLEAEISYPVSYRGRNGRDARTGGYFSFDMKVKTGQLSLQASYWGEERNRRFKVLVEGEEIAYVELNAEIPGQFIEQTYPIPLHLTAGKETIKIRFEPKRGYTAGPVFGCRLIADKPSNHEI